MLNTSVEDLQRVTERYLSPEKASIGIISNKESVESLKDDGIEIIIL